MNVPRIHAAVIVVAAIGWGVTAAGIASGDGVAHHALFVVIGDVSTSATVLAVLPVLVRHYLNDISLAYLVGLSHGAANDGRHPHRGVVHGTARVRRAAATAKDRRRHPPRLYLAPAVGDDEK